eukprot:scaffold51580_cov36-Phaeocystis_antarctica.AAC.1
MLTAVRSRLSGLAVRPRRVPHGRPCAEWQVPRVPSAAYPPRGEFLDTLPRGPAADNWRHLCPASPPLGAA